MFQVRWRSRLRSARDTGGVPDAIAPSGRSNSGVDRIVSMRLLGRVSVSNPGKRKNVCQPIKRLLPLAPPRKSVGSPPAGLPSIMPPYEIDATRAQQLLDQAPASYLVVDNLEFLDVARRYAAPVVARFPDRWSLLYVPNDSGPRIYRRVGNVPPSGASK